VAVCTTDGRGRISRLVVIAASSYRWAINDLARVGKRRTASRFLPQTAGVLLVIT